MSDHPYKGLPARSFWRSSVAPEFITEKLVDGIEPLLHPEDRIMSAGSCFAANMIPWLEGSGFTYVRTEVPPPALSLLPENLAYRKYSAAFGNVYTARQFRQLVERAAGFFRPVEDRWYENAAVIDPFRPGLAFPASSDQEFDDMTACHLAAVRRAVEQATVLVFTLGLTETWASRVDGAVYPTCPGTVAGTFDESKYTFVQLNVDDVVADMRAAIAALRMSNPRLRVILTVSPVPLTATAAGSHVLSATILSKSVLRVAAQAVVDAVEGVRYFPAYEIVTGPQAPEDFFELDRRSVSQLGVQSVMDVFLGSCELPVVPVVAQGDSEERPKAMQKLERKVARIGMSGRRKKPGRTEPVNGNGAGTEWPSDSAQALAASEALSKAMCDEELLATWAPQE